jgi:hypothetical protein
MGSYGCATRDARKATVANCEGSTSCPHNKGQMRMSKRSQPSSPRLTLWDAIEIWKRRRLGEAIHHIAAAFRVNPGRICEVLSGKRFPEAEQLSLI